MRHPRTISVRHGSVAAIAAVILTAPALLLASADSSSAAATFAPRSRANTGPVRPRSSSRAAAAPTTPPSSDLLNDSKFDAPTSTSSTSTSAVLASPPLRGGAVPSSDTSKQITGALYFLIMDVALRQIFASRNIAFPSQLAGCLMLFVVLVLAELVRPGVGEGAFEVLSPGATLLAKWLPVFFVPGLAGLPLAPDMGSPFEVVKVLGVVVLGFFFSLFSTTYTVLGLRKLQGAVTEPAPVDVAVDDSPAPAAPPKAFSDETLDFLVKGTVVSAAISIAATKTDQPYKVPLQTVFHGFATLASFVWGARFPPSVTKFLHPILTSTGMAFLTLKLTGLATGDTFLDVLGQYKTGSLDPLKAGAGDYILYLLGPAVISFAIAMYSRRSVMASNLPTVATGIAVGSAGSLFGTAAFVRAINLGGTDGCFLRLSTVPRNVTTALAMVIAKIIGGDVSIAASLVVLTGMFAAMIGARTLDAVGVTDPVSRGLGIGAAGQSLGAASISKEKEAFPFAAVNMVMVAVAATVLASIPAVGDLLIKISCGGPKVVEDVVSTAA